MAHQLTSSKIKWKGENLGTRDQLRASSNSTDKRLRIWANEVIVKMEKRKGCEKGIQNGDDKSLDPVCKHALCFLKNDCNSATLLLLELGFMPALLEHEQSESKETPCDSQGQVVKAHVASNWPCTTLEVLPPWDTLQRGHEGTRQLSHWLLSQPLCWSLGGESSWALLPVNTTNSCPQDKQMYKNRPSEPAWVPDLWYQEVY